MIQIQNENIGEAPSMIVEKTSIQGKKAPLIVYLHGYNRAKEHGLTAAYLLAEAGARVVVPDALYHGERQGDVSKSTREREFWNIIIQNVQDLSAIQSYFKDKELLLEDKFGVGGTSMGAISTGVALTIHDWIDCAGMLMGTAHVVEYAKILLEDIGGAESFGVSEVELEAIFKELKAIDLSQNLEKLNERPLFMWHGGQDEVIPKQFMDDFYISAKQKYKNSDLLHYEEEAQRGHKLSRSAILKFTDWFTQHLIKE